MGRLIYVVTPQGGEPLPEDAHLDIPSGNDKLYIADQGASVQEVCGRFNELSSGFTSSVVLIHGDPAAYLQLARAALPVVSFSRVPGQPVFDALLRCKNCPTPDNFSALYSILVGVRLKVIQQLEPVNIGLQRIDLMLEQKNDDAAGRVLSGIQIRERLDAAGALIRGAGLPVAQAQLLSGSYIDLRTVGDIARYKEYRAGHNFFMWYGGVLSAVGQR